MVFNIFHILFVNIISIKLLMINYFIINSLIIIRNIKFIFF